VLWHLPVLVGLVAAIATGAMLGLAVERLTMRPLDRAPPLSRVVVTIGWLLVLQTAAGLIWGDTSYHQAVRLVSPAGFRLPGTSVIVGYDQLTTLLAALGLALATAAVLRWTSLGLQLRAVADDPFAARLWGIKVDRIRALSWMTGSAMAAIAGVLITPRVNFTTFALTLVVLDAFAAALIGRLVNLPAAVGGALVLGLAQTYPTAFVSNSGVSELVTFLVVLAALWLLFRPGVVRTRVA
jgi:branched-subunit amino acid ABC-type transport system permease component